MANFLKETMGMISNIKKTEKDIKFIAFKNVATYDINDDSNIMVFDTFEEFKKVADFMYDDGYGGNEIHRESVVVFNDHTWLSRGEYDGSEWWEYNKEPTRGDYNQTLN